MSNAKLPDRASLEYLKKLAKDRLHQLRQSDPAAKLAHALLAVAREYGFPSWRALKAEIERRQQSNLQAFIAACLAGEVAALEQLLNAEPSLATANSRGWTGLHTVARAGHLEAARLLLSRGADPNAREEGDNTTPLHWAAARGDVNLVRLLLDSGADVHGFGDVHALDVIGWGTFYHTPGGDPPDVVASRREMVALLLERGARHHIFSAMSLGDLDLIRHVAEDNLAALDRHMSHFERGQTPLHFAMDRKRYDILDLLIDLGADLEAVDAAGRTTLAVAMLHGDQEAMRRLHAAGATPPEVIETPSFRTAMTKMAESVSKGVPMIFVPDVARALDWYMSIGFKEVARYGDDSVVNFGMVSFGKAELMLNMHGKAGKHDVTLWFYTDKVDDLYQALKSRQLAAAQATIEGGAEPSAGIDFQQDIEDMFYGARQFCIRDLNGFELYFIQSIGVTKVD